MAINKFKNGSVLYTGDDIYDHLMRSFNKRNNYDKTCDFCKHEEDSEECDGCSLLIEGLSCSCHRNPPCSKCVNSKFEPTPYLINYKNYKNGREMWECFPTTKEIFSKFEMIEKEMFGLHAEILTTGEVAIYLKHVVEDYDEVIEICKKVKFKSVSQKMIVDLFDKLGLKEPTK